jgi:hypothetical protein
MMTVCKVAVCKDPVRKHLIHRAAPFLFLT